MPRVSVIVPTILSSKFFLLRALKSLVSQSHKPFEIILVFDGIYQETSVINELIKDLEFYPIELKILCTNSRAGGSKARNIGINEAGGEIIMFLDDDDAWHPDKILIQLDAFISDDDLGLHFTGRKIFLSKKIHESVREVIPKYKIYPNILMNNFIGITSSVAIRKEVIKSELFDELLPCRQDYDLWIRLVNNKVKIKHSSEPLTFYTIFDNAKTQVSSRVSSHIFTEKYLLEKYTYILNSLGLIEKLKSISEKKFSVAKAISRSNYALGIFYMLRAFFTYPNLKFLILLVPNFFEFKKTI